MRITAVFIFLILVFSCKKESFTSNPNAFLTSETDSLHFDTVFTTTGSTSQRFKIFNENTKGIHINSIQLKGGAASPFKINAMGIPGPVINNIDIADNDSIYVFVTVHINPNAANLPFVVKDSIEVLYNGNKKIIQLEAYGRNAHFYRSTSINANLVWNNDLPYVIIGGIQIEKDKKLTINEGCKIYMHADAPIIVSGTLEVLGKKWDSTKVLFTGDRLDEPFRNYPASWPGIYFNPTSKDNVIKYAEIKNGYQSVVVLNPSVNAAPKLFISETIIDNSYDIGLLGINTKITGQNLLISNCGKNMVLAGGGDYKFTHCTVASYNNKYIPHKEAVLWLSDTYDNVQNTLTAVFTNCIFWGEGGIQEGKDEVQILKTLSSSKITFENILWKVKGAPNATFLGTPITLDPMFSTIDTDKLFYDFRLKKASPAENNGANTSITLDLAGNARPAIKPDLGCYEIQ